jgi:hypothetical protein
MEQDSWKAYRCTSCGLGFLDPRPTKQYMAELYRREYFAEQYDEGVDPDSQEFRKWLSLLDHRVRFFRHKKKKDFHSERVKSSLKRIPVVSLFSRLIARLYSGTSVAMLAVRDSSAATHCVTQRGFRFSRNAFIPSVASSD